MMVTDEAEAVRPRGAWDDPTIPAGDSPPLPAAPLWIAAAAWLGWFGFLVYTAASA